MVIVHVFPIGDIIEHQCEDDSVECICNPTVQFIPSSTSGLDDAQLVVHDRMDGSEGWMTAEKLEKVIHEVCRGGEDSE